MVNDYYKSFLDCSLSAIKNHSDISSAEYVSSGMERSSDVRCFSHLSSVLRRSIEHLDEELLRFEKNFSSSKNTLFWASDYNDVFASVRKIIKKNRSRSVRLPNINNSTIFRELGIKYFLQDEKIELSDDADLQFFAVDMMFSDTGSLLLVNQSNNSFSKISNNVTNIFFATIDQICCSSEYVESIKKVLSYRNGAEHQDMILFRTSPNCHNYLFIIDNQRSSLLKDPFLRRSLTCLHCGRCNDVCPVHRIIGDEPYNNVFTGPMANITLPFLESFESYKHVTYVCTLCGQCELVCPLALPLRDLNIHVRSVFISDDSMEKKDRQLLAVIRKYASNRKKLNGTRFIKKHLLTKHLSSSLCKNRVLPSIAPDSFNKSFSS